MTTRPPCSVPDCQFPSRHRGWCVNHYARWRRYGDPEGITNCSPLWTPEERFVKLHEVGDPEDCWEWQGPISSPGYAVLNLGKRHVPEGVRPWVYAHRYSWEFYMGPIPEGLQVDHVCFNKRCVNPNHLDPVTPRENTRRAKHLALATQAQNFAHLAFRTHCPNGHELTVENTWYRGDSKTKRCRTCKREQTTACKRRIRERKKAAR